MIPIKLSICNFMCYRDKVPPLYFDGIHTACICGDNGSGKSALIDAITWALWGKTRSADKSDDPLIHSTQNEMQLEFDFAVGQQTYRVIRKHARPKRRQTSGQSSLDLFISSGDGFRPISGDRKGETQRKIVDILHMDYDTFVNSAYLRQGHADQFTVSDPAKRKEVLANILGLSFYDGLEERAKELTREREVEKEQLESAISDISSELDQEPAYRDQLGKVQIELSRVGEEVSEQKSRLDGLRQQKDSLDSKKEQLEQLEKHIAGTEKDLSRWGEQIKQCRSRLNEYEDTMSQRAIIEERYAQLAEARRLNDELTRKLRLVASLNERKYQLEMAVERANQSRLKEQAMTQSRVSELEAKSLKLSQIRKDLERTQLQLHRPSELEEVLREKKQNSQQLQVQLHYLESSTAQLEREIAEIEEKTRLLLTQREAKCPLCETELGADRLKLIEIKYSADRQGKSDSLKSNRAALLRTKKELESLENEVFQLETKINQDRATAQGRAGILSQQVAEAEEAGIRLTEEREKLAEIEESLAKKDFAISEQVALADIKRELAKLNYDSEQHKQVGSRLGELEQYEADKRRLEEADKGYSQTREDLSNAEKASQELRQSMEFDNQKRQSLAEGLSLLPRIMDDLVRAEAEYQTLIAKQKQVEEAVWAIKEKLRQCTELEKKKAEKQIMWDQASQQEEVYRELAEAFGRKGIQALLIETALPEIEVEANKLLARMTDNRMHAKIETQRPTKKGDMVETLDINISDELGTRNYEMFSGGEAFRINFAIRIALSKLLARRAGAPLPTLIIDEGFGTQDSDGIEKLKEAINSIQDDFDKILVITHIEELKDAFPTRIEVVKTAEGSMLRLS